MVWLGDQGLGRNMFRKLMMRVFEKEGIWTDLSNWAKIVKTSVYHMNVYQRVTPVKENFNKQQDKMTCTMDNSLFPTTPVITQRAHVQCDQSGKNKVMHGPSNMNSQSQRPVWLWHCSIPNLPVAETNTEFQIRHHSLGWSASCRVTGWLHWTAFITEEAVFRSYRNRCLLWIWIGIFNMSCFFQNHPPRVYRMPYAAKEVWQMAHAPWTHLSYHVPQHPEVPGLADWWNGLVQTQLQCLLCGSISQR